MKIKIDNFEENPANFFRKIGYIFVRHEDDEMSFVRILARSGYPRFHIFAHMHQGNLIINIHLDRKKKTYGNSVRHHGEYEDSDLLKKEVERIKKFLPGSQSNHNSKVLEL